jgi:hypothetical protein
MRALLIVSTLTCVGLGTAVWYREFYARQSRAIEDLVKLKFGKDLGYFDRSKTWRGWLLPAELARDSYTLTVDSSDHRLFESLKSISCRQLYVIADDFGDNELSEIVRSAPNLEKLVLRKSAVTDRGLTALRGLKSLRFLSLGDLSIQQRVFNSSSDMRWYEFPADQFTDEAFDVIAVLPQLDEFRVISNSIGDRQLAPLSHSTQLKTLAVVSNRLTDDCLRNLAGQNNLQRLLLGSGQFSTTGLEKLGTMTQLKLLALKSSRVDDSACQSIALLKSLEMLCLENTSISNEGLSPLAELPKLWKLYLAGPELDNRLLKELRGCPMLAHLHLANTKFDDGGVDDLLSLRQINEIFVTNYQLTKSAKNRIAATKPRIAIYDQAFKDGAPEFFFDTIFPNMTMNADYVPPN